MLRGNMLRQALILEHVQECRLPGIVQPQEEDLGILVSQAKLIEHGPKVVQQPHDT
jgi:hypothetical protein